MWLLCFNSTLVLLKVAAHAPRLDLLTKFQFHTGSIEGHRLAAQKGLSLVGFNSTLVLLKGNAYSHD